MANVPPAERGPGPTPDPFEFTGETPSDLARYLEGYARHLAAAARFEAGVRAFETARARREAEATLRASDAARRHADRLDRQEAAQAREAARREWAAARASRQLLRDAVLAYSRQLRAEGVPPYHVLVTMTTIVRRAAESAEPLPDPEALTADVIEWSLASYYGA